MMNDTSNQVPLLASRQHFEILDGLRGIAAIAVVIFHFMEIAVPDYNDSFIAHAYLAVDFFFCLSGFVIAYAYDRRISNLGLLNFLKLRLIRLHPLVIIGAVIGLAVFVFDPFSNLYRLYADSTLLLFLSSGLLIPYPLVRERYFNLFHLNPPTWSLFWEYIANIGYGLFLYKAGKKVLWSVTIIAALSLIWAAKSFGNLGIGWGGDNYIGGAARIAFSFTAGILVYRLGWRIRTRLGFAALGSILLAVFLLPFSEKYNWIIDPAMAIFVFPILVATGAGAAVHPATSRVCELSGEISYPLYMIHYPFIWLFMSYVEKYKPGMSEMIVVMLTGVISLVLVAYLVLVYVDVPIRRYFKNKMTSRPALPVS
ncbi:acyltransferase family protein [Chitinophaga terrae (ex Kim and Jung 2007)]|nr:acyltransferase [Chitinophaga terrae (ex Kim and Jung 2007)]